MNLNIKDSFKKVFSLKFFWIYLFIFAVITTISNIFQKAENIPNSSFISSFISCFSYISLGYLIIMINKVINNDNENFEENFWTNFVESTKQGFKALVGIFCNILILLCFDTILMIVAIGTHFFATKKLVSPTEIMNIPAFIALIAAIALFTIVSILLISHLLPVAFSEKYSIKDMFNWVKVLNIFFKKGYTKRTLAIFGIYILALIIIIGFMFSVMFIFNFVILFFAKTLLVNHYIAMAFLINLSYVLTPFLIATLNFMLSGGIFRMFANVYKESLNNIEIQNA